MVNLSVLYTIVGQSISRQKTCLQNIAIKCSVYVIYVSSQQIVPLQLDGVSRDVLRLHNLFISLLPNKGRPNLSTDPGLIQIRWGKCRGMCLPMSYACMAGTPYFSFVLMPLKSMQSCSSSTTTPCALPSSRGRMPARWCGFPPQCHDCRSTVGTRRQRGDLCARAITCHLRKSSRLLQHTERGGQTPGRSCLRGTLPRLAEVPPRASCMGGSNPRRIGPGFSRCSWPMPGILWRP